jgi:hypothetical protein
MQDEFLFTPQPEPEKEQALLTSLLQQARLYDQSDSYKELLDFINRLPHIAPFNALLLNIQKPGLRFAAFEQDWRERLNRTVKEGARPLVILWPFGPVAFVYDIEDTEGDPLPADVAHAFRATGSITATAMTSFEHRLWKSGIYLAFLEYGDGYAGHIKSDCLTVENQSLDRKKRPSFRIRINARHELNVQFATLVHELAHLYLGHLGQDAYLRVPDRSFLGHEVREIEAESVSYLVCHRADVHSEAEKYIAGVFRAGISFDQLEIYAMMRAAGQIETILGIAMRSRAI